MQAASHLLAAAMKSRRSTVFAPYETMKLMKTVALDLPALAFIVVTRAALAAGVGLLVSGKLSARQRRSVGATLLGVGAATTIPAVLSVLRGIRRFRSSRGELPVERDRRLIGTTRYRARAMMRSTEGPVAVTGSSGSSRRR